MSDTSIPAQPRSFTKTLVATHVTQLAPGDIFVDPYYVSPPTLKNPEGRPYIKTWKVSRIEHSRPYAYDDHDLVKDQVKFSVYGFESTFNFQTGATWKTNETLVTAELTHRHIVVRLPRGMER